MTTHRLSIVSDQPSQPASFLERLRPGGPWALTSIYPDGAITTKTVATAEEVDAFVSKWRDHRNIYYSVNPTVFAMDKKAKKTDINCVEYLHADLDPLDDETPEAAKERYLTALKDDDRFPQPTFVIDSGNGIQALWKLDTPLDAGSFGRAEATSLGLIVALGYPKGETYNVDRILRIPGTRNFPNKKKKKAGRVECEATLIEYNDVSYPFEAFAFAAAPAEEPNTIRAEGLTPDENPTIPDGAVKLLEQVDAGKYPSRSELLLAFLTVCARKRVERQLVHDACLDPRYAGKAIYQHCKENGSSEYVVRQMAKAWGVVSESWEMYKGAPIARSQHNIRLALFKLGIGLRYDEFNDQILVDGLPGHMVLDDATSDKIWLTLDQRFKMLPSKDLFRPVLMTVARENTFHPVRDYLDGLTWDGVPRVDTWLIDYCGVEDTEFIRAVAKIVLVAGVRRIRRPGCKFDELPTFEGPQGKEKSTLIATLAVREEWFTDDLPLNVDGKKIIEQTRGKWIAEAPELSGLSRADVEHVKSMLSRRTDRARLAYGYFPIDVPRQFIMFGTTNSDYYLRDTTGNRRNWPIRVGDIRLTDFKKDIDQLWAEAVQLERGGASIRLDPSLWKDAAEEQAQRSVSDPWFDVLQRNLGSPEDGADGKLLPEHAWAIVGMADPGKRIQEHNRRLGSALRVLGFERVKMWIGGRAMWGYRRGGPDAQMFNVVEGCVTGLVDGSGIRDDGDVPF